MAKLSNFPKEYPLHQASIETRVDLAKIAAYAVFSEEKSDNDFYFENLLNCFIALVQYPVSFVVLEKGEVAFHLCHDKEHYQPFSTKVEKVAWSETNSFALFKGALGEKYQIAVYLMHTKKFEADNKIKLVKRVKPNVQCETAEQYIAICAEKFFEGEWFGFRSKFSFQAKGALDTSLDKLAATYVKNSERAWPQPAQDILNLQKSENIDHPNSDPGTWNRRVDALLTNVINDSRYGIRAFTGINHVAQGDNVAEPYWKEVQPPNMLVAYRSYTRRQKANDAVKPRHVTKKGYKNRNSGYAHNVNFVVPVRSVDTDGSEEKLDPYSVYFQFLRRRFSSDWRKLYEAKDSGRLLYGNLFDALVKEDAPLSKTWKKKIKTLQAIGRSADERFWEILDSGSSGIEKVADILRSQVGDYARSMADPLFSTGIIHINPGYEVGGLDRILYSQLEGRTHFDELETSVQIDVLRIVAVYYYFCGAASWAGEMPRAKDPRKLCIMLLPIKMRGAVWGASAHAFYLEDYEQMFLYNSTWLSNFLLATSGRQKFQGRFDGILWEAAQQRVLDLLVDNIGATRSPLDFIKAIENVNRKVKGEQLLTPYALPQFTVEPALDASRGQEGDLWFVGHKTGIHPEKGNVFVRLVWVIAENEFFSARQPWSKRGTRSFLNIVDLGLRRGLEQMKSQK